LIFKYIFDHDLLDIIVEFKVYGAPTGTQNEQVVITEIRTDF